jgi:hypothetical protein
MIAYNRTSLDNRNIQEQAAEALSKKIITAEESDRIRKTYPCPLYTPNFFIRIGLFLLTLLTALCTAGIYMLGVSPNGTTIGGSLIFFGIVGYIVLELFIHVRKTYRSGIDDALLYIAGCSIVAGIGIIADFRMTASSESLLILILALLCAARYADSLMALTAYGALLSLLFYTLGQTATGQALLPFVVLFVSVVVYLLAARGAAMRSLRHYQPSLLWLRVASLLTFYAAGNYFIITVVHSAVSHEDGPVALGFLWWTLTALVPVFYIVLGVRKKDPVFLWSGLLLVAAAVFTVRVYYHVLPAELAMVLAGSILVAGAWYLIRYLHEPKHGFTSAATDDAHLLGDIPVEGLIMAESFRHVGAPQPDQGTHFGGGTTGGGGAGGEY